ncbi:MAG: sugar phosphate isomerase/epimerase family protein [Planctomycetota bacterium]
MKFALCSETFDDVPLEEAFGKIASHGYEGVEIAPFHATGGVTGNIGCLTPARWESIAAAAREAGVEIIGLHWLLARTRGFSVTSTDAVLRECTADYLGLLADFCAALGGKVLVFGSPPQRTIGDDEGFEDALPRAVEVFKTVAARCENLGVELLIEPLGPKETRFVNTKDEGVRLVEAVGSPAFGLHLDVKGMATEAKPISQIVEEAAGVVRHFHANDELARGPGFGPTDLRPFAEAVKKIGYDGWISVEPFDTTPGRDVVAGKSLAHLRECFA